ncbi:MAG: Rpn family recombination-promoting nuclease/putative transposase [Bacteroidota bacterium]
MPDPTPLKRYIPFTSDYGFKVTFGNEHNTLFLRRALQAVINMQFPIEEVIFEKNTKEPPTVDGRFLVYDFTCQLDTGEIAIVEMQLGGFPFMVNRLKYYTANRMIPFVKRGRFGFRNIPQIFCITFMNTNLFRDDDYIRTACLYDEKHRLIDDGVKYIFIELAKFNKSPELCMTDLDKLIYTMKTLPQIEQQAEIPDFMQEEWLASALKELDSSALTPEARAQLEMSIAREMSSILAPQQWADYMKEEGLKEGIEQGIEQGIEINLHTNIRNILSKHPDWTDFFVADLLQISEDLVRKVRAEM